MSNSYAGFAAPYLEMIALHAQGQDDAAYALLESGSLSSADLARLTAALLRIRADAPFAHSDGDPSLAKIDAQLAVLLARHAWRHDRGMRAQALYRELLQVTNIATIVWRPMNTDCWMRAARWTIDSRAPRTRRRES